MHNNLRFVKYFMLLAMVIITIATSSIFVAFYFRTIELTEDILLQQSRALFKQILLTRQWASIHGGVYVKVRPGINPNPFLLKLPGVKVNIRDKDGSMYTLRNPGLIVRELSELCDKEDLCYFHVASLTPANPKNSTPDNFERKALLEFEKGVKELTAIENVNGEPVYRYMAPLYYAEECDSCHISQGLKSGDVRGGISIGIPMHQVVGKLKTNRLYMIASALLVLSLLLGALFILSTKLLHTIRNTQDRLFTMAITDGLTDLPNRTNGIERVGEEISRQKRTNAPLSCLMLDIDHFKQINDTYGHQTGDVVLKEVADVLKDSIRKHDLICRYGGEEFLILLPETDLSSAIMVAEKIRARISKHVITCCGEEITLTISIGATQADTGKSDTTDSLILRADCALYKAKANGRNRVETESNQEQDLSQSSA